MSAPASEAPTTRFKAAKTADDRDIGSWLGELRRKTSRRTDEATNSGEPTTVIPGPSAEPTQDIASPASADATTAMPTVAGPAEHIPADETRAIPVSRPETADTEVATEKLNSRGTKGGGVSAQDLLRREGRL